MSAGVSQQPDWRSVEYRRALILSLRDACKTLTPFLHNVSPNDASGKSNKEILLDMEIPEVEQVVCVLENVLLHGIKIREFQQIIPLWGLLERLEVITNPPCNALRNTVGAVASCSNQLRNPLGKARGWIRQSLNAHNLDESVQFMINQPTWLNKFYYPEAILRVKADAEMLLAVMRSLKIYSFSLLVDDARLNELPLHLTRMVSMQSNYYPPTNSNSNANSRNVHPSNPSSSGGFFDAFLRSFEIGFDNFVSQVDQLISTPIVIPDSLKNPLQVLDNSPPTTSNALTNNNNSYQATTPMPPFFGSSLRQLIMDERRCAHANLDPYLGIPIQALRMLNFLSHHASAPHLFRTRAPINSVEEMKKMLEQEKALQQSSMNIKEEIAVVSTVFITWLSQLPEPLFGYDHYHAILACENLEDPAEKLQVLKLLLCDTPWYYKPLLVRLFSFWQRCLQPEIMLENGLNSIALALIATPICLRPPPGDPIYDASANNSAKGNNSSSIMVDNDAIVMSITAAGSGMIRFIIEHAQELIIEPFHQELSQRQEELSIKWQRIRLWQQELLLMIDWKKFLALPQGEKTLQNVSFVGASNNHNMHNLKLPAAGEDDAVEDMLQLGADEDALLDDSHDNTNAHVHHHAHATKHRRNTISDAANEEMFGISSDTRLTTQRGITRPRRSFSTSSNGPSGYSSTGNPVTGISYIGHRRQEEIDVFVRRLWKALRPVQLQLLSSTAASRLYEGSTATDALLTASHSNDQLSANSHTKSNNGQVEESKEALEIDDSDESDRVSRMTRIKLFQDTRWMDCAFTLSREVLQDCGDVHGGYVALKCLVLFMETFPDKAPAMALEFAQARRRFCSMPQVAVKLVHFVSEVLSLAQSTAFATKTIDSTAPLGHLARQPSWPLLTTSTYTSEYGTFGELFNLAFFIFDDIWRGQCEILHEPLSLETFSQSLYHTRSILWELILQRPNTIPKLWEIWASNVRLAQVERLYAVKRKQAVQQRPLGQLTVQYTTQNIHNNNNNNKNMTISNTNNSSGHNIATNSNTPVVGTATIVNQYTNNVMDNCNDTKHETTKETNQVTKKKKTANNKAKKASTVIVSPKSNGPVDEESLVDLSLDSEEDDDEDGSVFRDDSPFSSSSSGSSKSYVSVTNDEDEEEEEGFDRSEGFEPASFIINRDHANVNENANDITNKLPNVTNNYVSEMDTTQHNGSKSRSGSISITCDANLNRVRQNSNANTTSVSNSRRNSLSENSSEPPLLQIDLRTNPLGHAEDPNHFSSSKSDSELFERLVTGRGIHTVVISAAAEAAATATQQHLFRHNTSEFHNQTVDLDDTLLHPEVPELTPTVLVTSSLQKSEDPSATTTVVNENTDENGPTNKVSEGQDVPPLDHNLRSGHVYIDDPHNEIRNRVLAAEAIIQELNETTAKTHPLHHITTQVKGSSKILSLPQILALEMKLPQTLQCYDWQLVYRLSIHGASLSTLYAQAQRYNNMVLIVQENTPERAIFGAVITDNLKVGERDKYYGNGSMALFSMYHPEQATNDTGLVLDNVSSAENIAAIVNNNAIRYYPWSYKNSYFMITCRDYIALGGGGHFGLYLDSDLFRGSSGQSATFQNTTLSSIEDFSILSCELYALQAPNRS